MLVAGNVARMIDEHRQIVDAAAATAPSTPAGTAAAAPADHARLLTLISDHLRVGYAATMTPIDPPPS